MRFGLRKLGRFIAGRVQGSKGVQKYDTYMEEHPFARGLTTFGDIVGAAVLGNAVAGSGAAAKAGGAIKSMLSPLGIGGGGGAAGAAGTGAAGAAGTAGAAGAAGAAGKAAFAKSLLAPQVLGSAIQGGLSMLPSAQSEALNAQTRLAQQQFDEEKRRTQMEEERKRRIAEMLMPFMQKNFPQYVSGGR